MSMFTALGFRLRGHKGARLVVTGWLGWSSIVTTMSCKETPSTTQGADASSATPAAPNTAAASNDAASAAPAAPSAAAASNDAAKPGDDAGVAAAASAKPASNVYPWEPAIVEIPGRLVRKPVAYSNGPVPVVVFDEPIRIETPGDAPERTRKNVTHAWLSYNGISKEEVNKLMGKKVTYKGMLNHMGTAHHLSDPWLDGTVTAR